MFNIKFKVNEKDLKEIEDIPVRMKRGLVKGMRLAMFEAERITKSRFGRPGELQVRTGHLRRSIESGVREEAGGIVGWLGSDVVYARIHEFGGIIKARAGGYLRFPIGDSWVSVQQVKIPPRPYLEPSIIEGANTMGNIILDSIIEEVD
jgi:phage gpG-like protein